MKKILAITMMALLLMMPLAMAQGLPNPIFVKVNAENPDGIMIKITNLITDVSKTFETAQGGEVATDAQIFTTNPKDTDTYRIEIMTCSEDICKKELTYGEIFNNGGVEFNVGSMVSGPCPECVCPECECPPVVECPVNDMTNEELVALIIGTIVILGGGLFVGKNMKLTAAQMEKVVGNGQGLKVYKSRDGKTVKVLHKHYGIRGYHDPNTSHKDPDERHPKGIIFPANEEE